MYNSRFVDVHNIDVRDIRVCWRQHCSVHCFKIFTTGMANRPIKRYVETCFTHNHIYPSYVSLRLTYLL